MDISQAFANLNSRFVELVRLGSSPLPVRLSADTCVYRKPKP
ncbi:hypothetical protein SAMN05443247_06025 [Bradyrhizobium erythrophlei]|jgi:hypothetical protein|nr:hypothetical protein SAMN05443247_06025 [Bradyrhizobium erythrophlei]